jgi:mono/diheme cytochrome c family protein
VREVCRCICRGVAFVIAVGFAALLTLGCRQEMYDQPKYEPLEASTFFPDDRASRPLVDGTVARGSIAPATAAEALRTSLPMPITLDLLRRGRQRYDIFCSPCHDRTGSGQGMVVRRGYRPPTSFHADRLREAPVGHVYDVITRGFGAMPDYAQAIAPEDRWAIAAYVKALQVAGRSSVDDVPAEERSRLESDVRGPGAGSREPGAH